MKVTFFSILFALGSAALARAETIVALTTGNRLLFFDSATPGTITKSFTVTTVGSEALVAIDFRPATGDLYAMAVSGRLYVLNLTTNAASIPPASPTPLVGTSFGFDFNPTVDRIRVTSDGDQNIRLNPNDGSLTATDTNLAYAASDVHVAGNPNIVGSAYTNNFVGATTTILYDIDSTFDTLVYQDPANAGQLHTVGNLGVDTNAMVGFDISQATGTAYASLTQGSAALYTINLASGAATLIGTIGNPASLAGELVLDIATPTATRLPNISTRGRVGTGDDVLIGGFINRGGGRLILRAIGPSLSAFGVPSPLQDPVLTLKDNNGVTLATNDDWQSSSQAAEISATGLAPTNSAESAILTSLPAGNYTGIVSGKGSTTGIALVEIFQLP
jgi:hypothetical protein